MNFTTPTDTGTPPNPFQVLADRHGRIDVDLAIYLVGQGTPARPRLLELQYRRILRYIEALKQCFKIATFKSRTFTDLNPVETSPFGYRKIREEDLQFLGERTGLLQLRQMLEWVYAHPQTFVIIDVDLEDNMGWIPRCLKASGFKVLNANGDDYAVTGQEYQRKLHVPRPTLATAQQDALDFNCFFPSATADLLAEIYNITDRNGRLPETYDIRWTLWAVRDLWLRKTPNEFLTATAELNRAHERFETQPLYCYKPNEKPELWGTTWNARPAEGLAWAEKRLEELGFKRRTRTLNAEISVHLSPWSGSVPLSGKKEVVSYLRRFQALNAVVYADPSRSGSIDFNLYLSGSEPVSNGRFSLQDSWVHGIREKLEAWVASAIGRKHSNTRIKEAR